MSDRQNSDLEARRAEVSAWFSEGPGGLAIVVVAIVVAGILVLSLVGLI